MYRVACQRDQEYGQFMFSTFELAYQWRTKCAEFLKTGKETFISDCIENSISINYSATESIYDIVILAQFMPVDQDVTPDQRYYWAVIVEPDNSERGELPEPTIFSIYENAESLYDKLIQSYPDVAIRKYQLINSQELIDQLLKDLERVIFTSQLVVTVKRSI